jgi:guanosine-3',5'-bis(diphosphate) 3'-pyrophosphohydrolase
MDIALWSRVLHFSAQKHAGQLRKDGLTPYLNHPIEVAYLLTDLGGVRDSALIMAALLHDTLEDTSTTSSELAMAFGDEICSLVQAVSDDKSLPKDERKRLQIQHASHLNPKAKQIKLADKICNLQDILAHPPADWSLSRRLDYFDWAEQVGVGLRGVNPALEARFDQILARKAELYLAPDL